MITDISNPRYDPKETLKEFTKWLLYYHLYYPNNYFTVSDYYTWTYEHKFSMEFYWDNFAIWEQCGLVKHYSPNEYNF